MRDAEQGGGGMGADWATIAAEGERRTQERIKKEILEERLRGYDRFRVRIPIPGDANYISYVAHKSKGGTDEQWCYPYGKYKSGFAARADGFGDF